MELREIAKKIADLLWNSGYGGEISFDHKSYDDPNDIPHLYIDGERYNVETFFIGCGGLQITTYFSTPNKEGCTAYDFALYEDEDTSAEDIERELEKYGFDELLRDVYYETSESYEIGDFEMDFLGI